MSLEAPERPSTLERLAPIARWLPSYDRRWLRPDIIAALTVWALIVPEAMAYASLAGVPPEAGLYAALAPLVLYAVFGTSRHVTVGPSSAIAILVAATVAPLAGGDGDRYIALTAGLALLVGVVLIIGGLARLGFVSEFLAKPVLTGFVIGLALVIAIGQVPKLLGIEIAGGNFFEELWEIITSLDETHVATLAVGAGSLVLMLALNRFVPKAPSALITVGLAIAFVALLNLEAEGVEIAGDIPAGLPPLGFPDIKLGDLADLLPGALAIALVAYAESIAGSRSFAARHGYEVDANQEMVALGASNVGTGLSQGFAVDVSLSRSAVNDAAGVKSQLSGIVNAGFVLITIVVLTPLFHDLPDAALAAVIIAAVAHLVDIRELRRLLRLDRADYGLAVTAAGAVLLFDVLIGILVAVVTSLIVLIHRSYRPQSALLGRVPHADESDEDYRYRDVERHPGYETFPGLVIFRFDDELYFANSNYFREEVRRRLREADPPARAILIDVGAVTHIDTTGTDMLGELIDELSNQDVELLLARAKGKARDILRRAGLEDKIGENRIFASVRAGVSDYVERHGDDG